MTAPAPKHWMRLPGSSLCRALLFIAWSLAAAAPARSAPPLAVVGDLNLDRYVGTWYEIARYPNFFERHCVRDVTASYARNADGTLRVVNACRKEDGTLISAEGVARVVAPARLKVRFALAWLAWLPLVWGDYWVIELGPDYSYAVVGTPSRKHLWILAREPQLDKATLAQIAGGLAAFGFDAARLERSAPRP